MSSKNLVLVLFILFFITGNFSLNVFAASELKTYQDALLVDIQIEKQVNTSYSNNTFSDVDIDTNTYHSKKQDKSNTNIRTNSYSNSTPSTSIKNTYYFEIKIDNLRYLTTFTPIWGNETDTNWIIGKPIKIRLNDERNRMYLLRPNGKELKTKILKVVSV